MHDLYKHWRSSVLSSLAISYSLLPIPSELVSTSDNVHDPEGISDWICIFSRQGMRVASVLSIQMCWYLSPVVILTVCMIICYQVYKVFFADSRSFDGISRYRSLNFLVFVIFFVVVFNLSETLLPSLYIIDIIVHLHLR